MCPSSPHQSGVVRHLAPRAPGDAIMSQRFLVTICVIALTILGSAGGCAEGENLFGEGGGGSGGEGGDGFVGATSTAVVSSSISSSSSTSVSSSSGGPICGDNVCSGGESCQTCG